MAPIDSTNVQQWVRHLLSTADVEPSSVPPSAILIVRALADPARGELLRDTDAFLAPPRWVRAAREQIDALYRQATYPADGPTPPSTPSVLFRDQAELLACLTRDFLLGNVSVCWWWQAWCRATQVSTLDDVLRAWCRDAKHAPAAIAILHDARLAAPFARALSPRQSRTLFVAVAEAHDLAALAAPTPSADVPVILQRADRRHLTRDRTSRGDDGIDGTRPQHAQEVSPPWEPFVPPSSVPATLGVEQRTLLGVALALWRAPLAVRTRAFQQAFHAWRRGEQVMRRVVAPDASPVPPTAKATAHVAPPVTSTPPPVENIEPQDAQWPAIVEPSTPPRPLVLDREEHRRGPLERTVHEPFARRLPSQSADAETTAASATTLPPRPRERPVRGSMAVTTEVPPPAVPFTDAPAMPVPPPVDAAPAPEQPTADALCLPSRQLESVRTSLGGVLFLLNALQRLELFDRLDDHFGVTSSIGGWTWLEIIARSLLGNRRSDATVDAIWDALAQLDGRPPGAAIAGSFRGQRSYPLPENWPIAGDMDATSRRRRRCQPLGLRPAGDLRQFLDTLVPYLRWRLLKAMALESHSPHDEDALLAVRLLCRRGWLTCTATHVDLHMDMDQVDIAVRLAGLDANPGWIPALGRVVTFHFE